VVCAHRDDIRGPVGGDEQPERTAHVTREAVVGLEVGEDVELIAARVEVDRPTVSVPGTSGIVASKRSSQPSGRTAIVPMQSCSSEP
jgi:hypothetical protein